MKTPADRRYNRPVHRGPDEPGDRLMRADDLYDLIIEIDHNDRPRVAGRGSAVFIHIARDGFKPTAGCVALRRNDLLQAAGAGGATNAHNRPVNTDAIAPLKLNGRL